MKSGCHVLPCGQRLPRNRFLKRNAPRERSGIVCISVILQECCQLFLTLIHYCVVQIVCQTQQPFVLVVDYLNAYAQSVVPDHQWHFELKGAPMLGAPRELHRQHSYRVRFNANPPASSDRRANLRGTHLKTQGEVTWLDRPRFHVLDGEGLTAARVIPCCVPRLSSGSTVAESCVRLREPDEASNRRTCKVPDRHCGQDRFSQTVAVR